MTYPLDLSKIARGNLAPAGGPRFARLCPCVAVVLPRHHTPVRCTRGLSVVKTMELRGYLSGYPGQMARLFWTPLLWSTAPSCYTMPIVRLRAYTVHGSIALIKETSPGRSICSTVTSTPGTAPANTAFSDNLKTENVDRITVYARCIKSC